jgi:hypothetical protein
LKDTLKRRGEHRKSFSALDSIIEESYPVGYEKVDQRHKEKRPDLKGQFIYAALIDIASEQHDRSEQYVATIKLDDSSADKRARFKDISIKKRPLYTGQTQEVNLANVNLTADRSISVQQLVDFVKSDFANSPLFSEKIPQQDNLRFLLSEYSESERRDITLVLKPFVGNSIKREDADYQQHLAKLGIEVSESDAHTFAVLAMKENQKDIRKKAAAKRDSYLYETFPLYREIVDIAGSTDFKIKPSSRFRGEEFSGSFISDAFVKFSKSKTKKNIASLDTAEVRSQFFSAAFATIFESASRAITLGSTIS